MAKRDNEFVLKLTDIVMQRQEEREPALATIEHCMKELAAGWDERDERISELDGRRREGRQLLSRMVKYVTEDCAKTPRSTRLARLTAQVADYLNRTAELKDVLR